MKFIYILLALFVFSVQAETMQKRLYKKRHNKVQITAGNLMFSNEFDMSGSVYVSYARNFGYFEVGGLLGLNPDINIWHFITGESGEEFKDLGLQIGIILEGNFIENKRRNNWIPSGGFKLIYTKRRDNEFYVNPFLSSKHFISSRTSINIELEYPLQVWEWGSPGENLVQGFKILGAYAYYFH